MSWESPLLHADMRSGLTNERPTRPALLEPSEVNEIRNASTIIFLFNGLHPAATIKSWASVDGVPSTQIRA